MAQFSYTDVQGLWQAVGGDPGWAPLMAGVAYGESGWDSTAWANRPSTSDNSVGLWQINYYGNLYPSRVAAYGTPESLQGDPMAQARAAVSILGDNAAGIGAWRNNPVVTQWQAAGSPQKPDAQTVAGWVQKVADERGNASPWSTPTALGDSSTLGPLGPQGAANPLGPLGPQGFGEAGPKVGCKYGSRGITLGAGPFDIAKNVGNACQLKALGGGLMIGAGAGLIIAGAVLLVAGTKAFQTLAGIAGTAVGGPGAGRVASGAAGALGGAGRSSQASRAIAGARQGVRGAREARADREEQALFDEVLGGIAESRRNPSPARRAYERQRPAMRRASERTASPGEEPF